MTRITVWNYVYLALCVWKGPFGVGHCWHKIPSSLCLNSPGDRWNDVIFCLTLYVSQYLHRTPRRRLVKSSILSVSYFSQDMVESQFKRVLTLSELQKLSLIKVFGLISDYRYRFVLFLYHVSFVIFKTWLIPTNGVEKSGVKEEDVFLYQPYRGSKNWNCKRNYLIGWGRYNYS